jgi:hypothetical protein
LADAAVVDSQRTVAVPRLLGLPMAAGYLLFMTGVYRAITGKPPGSESHTALASLGRIFFGLFLILTTLAGGVLVANWATRPF